MINYESFASLRLSDYFKDYEDSSDDAGWEWMGHLWFRQSIGFTWFGCHESEMGKTGAMELNFDEINPKTLGKIFGDIRLPLKPKITRSDIDKLLGNPVKQKKFVKDRVTCSYIIGDVNRYLLSCTIHESYGLMFTSIIKADILGDMELA